MIEDDRCLACDKPALPDDNYCEDHALTPEELAEEEAEAAERAAHDREQWINDGCPFRDLEDRNDLVFALGTLIIERGMKGPEELTAADAKAVADAWAAKRPVPNPAAIKEGRKYARQMATSAAFRARQFYDPDHGHE